MMAYFKGVVQRATQGPVWREDAGRHMPWWSFDNDKIHQNKLRLAYLKINANNRFPLPPNSPDMHRVVERTIGRLKDKFRSWLYDNPGKRTMAEYRAELQRLFKQTVTVEGMESEVRKLPKLWRAILTAKGGWPPKSEC